MAPPTPHPTAPYDWIDAHLDLAWLGVIGRDLTIPSDGVRHGVSWPDLQAADVGLVFGTIFTEMDGPADDPAAYPADDPAAAMRAGERQLEWYLAQERLGSLQIVRRPRDISAAGPLRVVLLMECADPIRDPADAARWVQAGVSIVGLSWGRGSRYAGGNTRPGGLTPIGRELVRTLAELGVRFDLSHLSREAFDDLLAATDAPVCATHSNAAAIVGDDPRHLTDEQLVSIRARDGIVGLNLYGRFLAPDHPMSPATVDHALDHVEHVASIVGRDRVGLGSDADGGFPATDLPVGLRRLGALATLADGLAARGWNPAEIDGFKRENWRRWWMSGPPTPSVSAPADATG